jgi:hypothetical protein
MEGAGSGYLNAIVVPANAGTIIPDVRDKYEMMIDSLSKLNRHGDAMSAIALTLGVPAFAGTTPDIVSAVTR